MFEAAVDDDGPLEVYRRATIRRRLTREDGRARPTREEVQSMVDEGCSEEDTRRSSARRR